MIPPLRGPSPGPEDPPPTGDPEHPPRIPIWVSWLLRLILPEEEREFVLGDLAERPRGSWAREVLGALSLRVSHVSSLPRRAPKGTHGDPTKHSKAETMLHDLFLDLRFAIRTMLRNPAFTVVALSTMALGIGANTAMFSIVNGVILKPLPYPEPDRIVLLAERNLPRGWESFSVAPLNFWDWQERNRSLELLAAYQRGSVNYTGEDQPQSLQIYAVTEDFLEILGGIPVRGRGITVEDLDPDGPAVAVLTYGFWMREFAGDPGVLGQAMNLDGVPHTIVGILPADWRPFSRVSTDLILPLRPQPFWYTARGSHFLFGLGRLEENVSVSQAQADLSSVAAALQSEYPDTNEGWDALVRPLHDVLLGSSRPQLLILLASVGLVLLIACANLANMILARTTGRGRELAIRTAVGAGKGRVVRQLLTESAVLAGVGGALGVGLAYFALNGFLAGWPTMLPRMQEIRIDTTALLFSLGISGGAGLVFGLVPALPLSGQSLNETIRQGARNITGDGARGWLRKGLVVAEVSLAMVLLVATGLLIRSFDNLHSEDPGFQVDRGMVFSTPLPRSRYDDAEKRSTFAEDALAQLSEIPGVEAVAISSLIPLEGSDEIWGFWKEANALPGTEEDGSALFYRVTTGYFAIMGIPILAGRGVEDQDRSSEHPVAVISASIAEEHFPNENPIGRRIKFGRDEDDLPVEIVGVVGDVQHYRLGESSVPQIYIPYYQRPNGDIHFAVRTMVPAMELAGPVREAIGAVDPDQPVLGLQPTEALIEEAVSMPRFRTLLMTGFGLTALLLAGVGLYGVIAYRVSQRTREIGVRMAMGATRGSVIGLVFRDGGPLVAIGLGLGLGGSLVMSRLLESMLFGVSAHDPVVFLLVPFVLALVAVSALVLPARRAVRVDPVQALGED